MNAIDFRSATPKSAAPVSHDLLAKQSERARLEHDIEAFIAAGGRIECLSPGESLAATGAPAIYNNAGSKERHMESSRRGGLARSRA